MYNPAAEPTALQKPFPKPVYRTSSHLVQDSRDLSLPLPPGKAESAGVCM